MAAFPRAAALAAAFFILTSFNVATAGTGVDPVRSPADPAYVVSMRSNADGTSWSGTMDVAFTNADDQPIDAVWLRLWGNGIGGCTRRAVQVADVETGSLGEVARRCTAQEIVLPGELGPGGRTSIRFALSIDVPARNDRFGHHAGMSMLGNALPVLAVSDDLGLHLDPYVDLGESFYSITGRYNVTLNVPSGLETAATGVLKAAQTRGARTFRTYGAKDVRDFAWAASLDFMSLTGHAGDTRVRVWFRPELYRDSVARSVLANSVDSMRAFSRAFGGYAYNEVDVVVSAFTTFGGMEYPQIVFSNPDQITVSHELAHQWWFGMVGNDQFAEPWLDESFATWSSYLPHSPWRNCVSFGWPSPQARLTNDMAYWRDNPAEYGSVYIGGGCMLANLAGRFGLDRFESILARYSDRYRFGVARTAGFQRVIERAAARRLEGFDAEAFWAEWRVG
jgi:hypothetical protein